MIEHIKIQKYRSLFYTEITFHKGVNLITGKTDSGKSTVVRAIRDVLYHRRGNDHVTHGYTDAKITIQFNNTAICWKKGANHNSYEILPKSKKWSRVGHRPPEEIQDLIDITPLTLNNRKFYPHIQSQHDPSWIVANRPTDNADILFSVSNLNTVTKAISKSGKDLRHHKRSYKQKTDNLTNKQYKLNQLDEIWPSPPPSVSGKDVIDKLSTAIQAQDLQSKLDKINIPEMEMDMSRTINLLGILRKAKEYKENSERYKELSKEFKKKKEELEELDKKMVWQFDAICKFIKENDGCPLCGSTDIDKAHLREKLL